MNVTIVLLDGGQFEVQHLRKGTLGKEIFKNACNKIGLTDETDYFGLRFINKKDAEFQWVDNERSIKSQLGKEANDNVTHYLHFAVKFFPINPTSIKNDLTRYQFVLQLRESLLNGRLECSIPIYALLGSFIAQAEFGDYDSPDISANYLEDFKVCPDQPPELVEKIHDYHRRHRGMTPEQAELNFLDNVRKLPMYGVHRHLALDVNCEKVFIGVSNVAVTVYRGSRLMSTFVWPQILSIGFKSKKFYIKIKPADEDDDFCKTSVGFKLSDRVAAKRLWKICVEHHTFFRLENVDLAEKKGWLSRFGSRFSYKGKTEHEIMKEDPKPTEEPFSRVSSKRFSERVLKGEGISSLRVIFGRIPRSEGL
ncbi:band 3 [Paramuricea clavata]|uniref:Band 3 n=1 Tax=Paramuricea clavata TaxID=317549 RepID=A0A6S7HWG5_PARCT|nr:band 3 [Paramuricea clavata]